MRISDIVGFLKQWAPLSLAESWDNTGLLWGDAKAEVRRVLTCLTTTPAVADEAVTLKADLIVSHHPVLFKPVQKITTDDTEGAMLWKLASRQIAVYSPHTAYDSAAEGINQQLAELLGLGHITPLKRAVPAPKFQIVVFVPEAQLASVQQAIWNTGAGQIGQYAQCSFFAPGTGTFCGSDETRPSIGEKGRLESVREMRLEVECQQPFLAKAIEAIRKSHPYEEPAYFIYPLEPTRAELAGTGRCGDWPTKGKTKGTTLREFVSIVKKKLKASSVAYVGDDDRLVKKVGIGCGAAGELLGLARAQGCDLFLTGEARFHTTLAAEAQNVALVMAGHYQTERPAVERLAERLHAQFPELQVTASRAETDPVRYA